ncbi:MAG TPA: ribonuclease D [Gammaproteobacteria bacterium]|nr:ribonuclease D [Gammaproteobacteria bacterium]
MLYNPPHMEDFLYIDRGNRLAELCQALARSEWLGIDTEFLREKTYYPKLCLIQVASDHQIACIDPLNIADLSPLAALLAEPRIVKVLHAARQDVEVLFHALGMVPSPIFDTQLAAGFCGYGDQIGYAALTAEIADAQLEKAHTRADWSRRPLDPDALAYAADDVRYLGTLYHHLQEQLDAMHRRDWLDAETAALDDRRLYVPDPDAGWLRVRGHSRVEDAGARGVLRAVATWRERRAMQKNRPRRWILTDEALIEVALRAPRSPAELGGIPGIGGVLKAGCGDQLVAAVADGLNHPLAATASAAPTPDERNLARRLSKIVREGAARMKVSPALLANRKQLEQLARGERNLPVLTGWRRELIGEQLLAAATATPADDSEGVAATT